MRTLAVLAVFVLVAAGCAVRTSQYYMPTDERYAEAGSVCGFVAWGQAQVPLGKLLSTSIAVAPEKGHVAATMQLSLATGTSVRLSEPVLRLRSPENGKEYAAHLQRFAVSIYGRGGRPGHNEIFDASHPLEGRGRNADLAGPDTQYLKKDLFVARALFLGAPTANSYVLQVPAVEVNGVVHESQAISLQLVETSGLMTCVQ